MYDDIAELMAAGIAENRGDVPGGIQAFKARIAGDVQFKSVLIPILDEVKREATAPVPEGGEPRHDWRDLLVSMIKDRTIVNAYSAQKGNPEAQAGIKMMQKEVNANAGEINKRIQAANQQAAANHGPQAGGNNQPQFG